MIAGWVYQSPANAVRPNTFIRSSLQWTSEPLVYLVTSALVVVHFKLTLTYGLSTLILKLNLNLFGFAFTDLLVIVCVFDVRHC